MNNNKYLIHLLIMLIQLQLSHLRFLNEASCVRRDLVYQGSLLRDSKKVIDNLYVQMTV